MMIRVLSAVATLALGASCGGDDPPSAIERQWSYTTPSLSSPAGIGPERRVLIGTRSGEGSLVTIDETTGTVIEGPFTTGVLPTAHAPLSRNGRVFMVSTIGKIVAYDLGGAELFSSPPIPFGVSSPPRFAPNGSIRLGTTSGRLLGFSPEDGETVLDIMVDSAVTSAPAIAPDGTTYVTTETGRVVGVDAVGTTSFDVTVGAPASGPSVDPATGRVAFGADQAVFLFEADGREIFLHPRAARVVGTRFDRDGTLIAWGEDGIVERLDQMENVITRFNAGPPIYADVVPLGGQGLGVIDSNGQAYKVAANGIVESTFDLGGMPDSQVTVTENGTVLVSVGVAVQALVFERIIAEAD